MENQVWIYSKLFCVNMFILGGSYNFLSQGKNLLRQKKCSYIWYGYLYIFYWKTRIFQLIDLNFL